LKTARSQSAAEVFAKELDPQARVFRAPGRVNLIGEHTDYNDGFVLPSAIGFYAHVSVSPRSDGRLVLRSTEFEQKFEFSAENLPAQKLGGWCDYVLGVATQLASRGAKFGGANFLVHSEVPVGAGLSSSAALEVASALAFLSLADKAVSLLEIALLCQRAENEFVGARVGIMDQFVSCHGKAGNAVLLDCRSLDYDLVPIPERVKLVICNTMVKHQLSGGEYNQRRAQCEEGVRILQKSAPGTKALRDVTAEQLQAHRAEMPDVVYRRCLHVVQEDERVLAAKNSFAAGDLAAVGTLMLASHASLRDLYEVSCRELDAMVEAATGLPGWIGGRMTGGGFGGCTVNLIESEHAEAFAAGIADRYHEATGITPDVFVCAAADGAGADVTSRAGQ
jgi:galactokinase